MNFLGLDIGTSAVKAVIVGDGIVLAEGDRPLATGRPAPGRSEQDPAHWIAAVEDILGDFAARAAVALSGVKGIGLAGQMHGLVCLGADHRPLRPAILWNDGRAAAEAARLNRMYPDLARIVGVPAAPGFAAVTALWLAEHEQATWAATRALCLPKDYVRLHLSGDLATDMSDAAGSWWLDEAKRAWSHEALAATGVSSDLLPRLVEGTAPTDLLRRDLARRWGMPDGVVIAGGGGDACAGAVGIGAVSRGAFISLGTSAQILTPGTRYRPLPERFLHAYCHCVPERWVQVAALLNGAGCLAWLASGTGTAIETLLAEAEALGDRPGGPIFLPYLTGERTPHNDPLATGAFIGLTSSTGRGDLALSVMEGVAYALADAADCLKAAGTAIEDAGVIGGGARSNLWVRILADVLGVPLTRYRGGAKGPAFGAACLGRAAVTGEDIADVATVPPVEDVIEPRPALTAAHAGRTETFRRLYEALKPIRPAG
jgi:xylulokinase